MNTDDKQKHLAEFNRYFPSENRESGIIKEIKEDLERIRGIEDLEEKKQKVRFF